MISKDRNYRSFEIRAEPDGQIVEGYAAVFEQDTVLYEADGIQYKEVISRGAFDHADMRDVVMNYNHAGKPVARTKNGTLSLLVDSTGLKITADLSAPKRAGSCTRKSRAGT